MSLNIKMGIFHMIPPLLHLQPDTKTIMRPTTSDPTETDSNGEPELPGAGAGATSFAPSDNAVGALADVDGCIPGAPAGVRDIAQLVGGAETLQRAGKLMALVTFRVTPREALLL